jgi:hypothetical protein
MRTDGWTDISKLMEAFRSFEKGLKGALNRKIETSK